MSVADPGFGMLEAKSLVKDYGSLKVVSTFGSDFFAKYDVRNVGVRGG